jgi:vacuolar-type H+-ATPase subunit F/Vma7
MSYVVRVVSRPPMAAGFRLAGLAVDEARSSGEAGRIVERLAGDPGTGILLVEQDLYDGLAAPLRQALERRPLPIVVPVPQAEWARGRRRAEDYILDLLQRAIGYRVRLQ